jgi:hypothetical protein
MWSLTTREDEAGRRQLRRFTRQEIDAISPTRSCEHPRFPMVFAVSVPTAQALVVLFDLVVENGVNHG